MFLKKALLLCFHIPKIYFMKRYLLLIIVLGIFQTYLNAANQFFFYVQLKNKHNNPYSLTQPEQFLSQRALSRRAAYGISCDSTDLPVNPAYISEVAAKGVVVHSRSKWLNGITIRTTDTAVVSQIRALSFVKWVKYTGQMNSTALPAPRKAKFGTDVYNYGTAATQINQLNGSALHNAGYTGRGIHIAVLDAGFNNVNTNPGFDSLRLQGRLLGTKDFAEPNSNIYALDAHGANVLSIMTGNLPGQYLGSAPHASFWLVRTEYAPTEYMMEVDFWVSGIEFADSVGVDMVNSSLGYTTFDDTSMSFTYANMDGKTSRASLAAGMAAQKGIVVCNSAGNDGNKTWKYIGSPADAEGIFAIGANTNTGIPSTFTSFGPSYDGRTKPEISGIGSSTAIINTSGLTSYGNGTSYSSPLVCGMLACLLQYSHEKNPSINVAAFREMVIQNSSFYSAPTTQLGYGITDFQQAMNAITTYSKNEKLNKLNILVSVNTNSRLIRIEMPVSENKYSISITDISGRNVYAQDAEQSIIEISTNHFPTGIYLLQVSNSQNHYKEKMFIQQ